MNRVFPLKETFSAVTLISNRLQTIDGCGIGGNSRHLADTVGCTVNGVDLTPDYIQVAESLTARVGLADRVAFHVGNALDLPFPDAHFDIVWTEHVQMNIADKSGFYGEMARVLKPDGQFIFHDLFLAEGEGEFLYPVPWAESCDISHMATPDQVSGILADLGLKPLAWVDKTDQSREFFADVVERFRTQGEPPVGLNLVMGTNWIAKFSNMLVNLEHGRVAVVQAVMQRSAR